MNVPFLDLKAQYRSIKEEIHAAINEVIENTAFAGGPFVAKFEQEFAKFCDCKHAIGVGNGTDALWMVLVALGVGTGDEVITSPNDYMTIKEALEKAGLTPEFSQITMKADVEIELAGEDAQRMQKLIDVLEGLDDVQDVFTNAAFEES